MRKIRTYHEVESLTGDLLVDQIRGQRRRLDSRVAGIRNLVAVGSGKGGVGKSLVTANLAAALAAEGRTVGALDADLNGPSLARMLGASGKRLLDGAEGVVPAPAAGGVRVMSMELLQNEADAPLRWRAPSGDGFLWQSSIETGAVREFLSDVAWGHLDFLLMDLPPGTDKMERVFQLLPGLETLLLVTTPSEMSRRVVARAARLADVVGREVCLRRKGETISPWALRLALELVFRRINKLDGASPATDAAVPARAEALAMYLIRVYGPFAEMFDPSACDDPEYMFHIAHLFNHHFRDV